MLPVKLIFTGDFAPIVPVERIINNHFEDISDIYSDVDLHISNLECPLTDSIQPADKTGPSIKADPVAVPLLQQANVNIACLANNHIFDYGEQGIKDTIKICEKSNIETLGIVSRSDLKGHWLIKDIKEKKIGFLNYCEHEFSVRKKGLIGACGYDPVSAYYDIKQLRPIVDYLIVVYHGGNEYYSLPRPGLKMDFHFLADLGADAVIGHHTHVFSGYELYDNKPLIYSLGNFFFPYEGEPESWHNGLICKIIIEKEISIELKFIQQCKRGYKIYNLTSDEENKCKMQLEKLSWIIKDDNELEKYWNDFVTNTGTGLGRIFLYPSKLDKLLKKTGITGNRVERSRAMKNIIKCSSLNNLLLDYLESENKK